MTETDRNFIIAVSDKFKIELIYTDRFIFPKDIGSDVVIAIFNYYREFIKEPQK
ncbi:hypothetical protein [Mucilaginibacter sp. L196]|uniref:hypothetical protein n=1 Tax=Mucilaginibacter sp. L196 TaxID=1641870 RepID=UPI00131C54FC|nr:hypothetical protein [Mucilaginibacter sp. L196]